MIKCLYKMLLFLPKLLLLYAISVMVLLFLSPIYEKQPVKPVVCKVVELTDKMTLKVTCEDKEYEIKDKKIIYNYIKNQKPQIDGILYRNGFIGAPINPTKDVK